ncbi:helix-turn-helix domain-containing protein [Halorubrum depositum]|uniref:helix-turn-helix domain-containing protein n=1 Tax=Halorubrum depositum TaxID=2583992 RepID=UPI00119D7DAB|nr:helix-turn-helix domain-containing protein [Halorubrum depositum]
MTERRESVSHPICLEVRLEDSRLILSSFTASHQGPVTLAFQPTQGLGWDCAFVAVEESDVAGSDIERLRTELERDPTVTEAEYIGTIGDESRFKVLFEGGVPLLPPETTEMGVHVISARHADGDWNILMHVPAHSTLHRIQSHYHDHGITFRVKRLHVARETDIGAETTLPPGQHKALLVAYRNGYFQVPRDVSQEEIADELDISKSGVSQRLRRAIDRLIEATLDP